MAFDVSKFLALTALIATTGYACSSTDKDQPATDDGGAPGTAGVTGKSGDAGAANGVGGGGVDVGGQGGATLAEGGAAVGGAVQGGQGGQGVVEVGECLGMLSAGGAGGAAAFVEPSLEDLCNAFYDLVCDGAAEGELAPVFNVCNSVAYRALPAVALKVADCLTALSVLDQCDAAKTSACLTDLFGLGCENPAAPTACTAIHGNCAAVSVADCVKVANLMQDDYDYEALTGCMDPGSESYFDPAFTGTCSERLDYCAGSQLVK